MRTKGRVGPLREEWFSRMNVEGRTKHLEQVKMRSDWSEEILLLTPAERVLRISEAYLSPARPDGL
jgi:hypothetical protein